MSAVLNALSIIFLVGMALLYFRDLPGEPALRAGDTPPED